MDCSFYNSQISSSSSIAFSIKLKSTVVFYKHQLSFTKNFRRNHPCREKFSHLDSCYCAIYGRENLVQTRFGIYHLRFFAAENRGVGVPGKTVGKVSVEQIVQAAERRIFFRLDEQHAVVEMADFVQAYFKHALVRAGGCYPCFQLAFVLNFEAAERNVERNIHRLCSRAAQAQHAVLKTFQFLLRRLVKHGENGEEFVLHHAARIAICHAVIIPQNRQCVFKERA